MSIKYIEYFEWVGRKIGVNFFIEVVIFVVNNIKLFGRYLLTCLRRNIKHH
jgi:hypothetical protein